MTIFDHYIRARLAWGFMLVLLLLSAIFSFLDFVEELEDTVTGHYGTADALHFIVLTLPERALALVPVSALLGSLLGLGAMEYRNELVAMRAAGVPARRIGWSALKAAGLLIALVVVVAEWVAPTLAQYAVRERALAISGDAAVRSSTGASFWFRDRQRFIRIRDLRYGSIPTDIEIYEFDHDGALRTFIHAAEAELATDGSWLLKDVDHKRFHGLKIDARHHASLDWQSFLTPQQGAAMQLDAESLSPTDLYAYARDLRARGQTAARYELALWRKLNIPLATGGMALLAVPFIFGVSAKPRGTGHKMLLGAGAGIVFYLADQMVAQMGLLAGIEPAVTATLPVAVLFATGIAMLRRVA